MRPQKACSSVPAASPAGRRASAEQFTPKWPLQSSRGSGTTYPGLSSDIGESLAKSDCMLTTRTYLWARPLLPQGVRERIGAQLPLF